MTEHQGPPIVADDRCGCRHCVFTRMREAGIPLGRGLLPHEFTQVVPTFGPSRDPVPAHVTKAAAKFDKKIADAESEVDVHLDAFTTADAAWRDAVMAARTISADSPILISADYSRGISRPEHEAQSEDAKRQVTSTFERREEAAYELTKARIKLQKLVRAREYAKRQARHNGPSGLAAIKAKLSS